MSFASPYCRNIYVASLPTSFTDEALRALFTPFGNIVTCTLKRDKETGICKGYGFVLFEREEDACNAVIGLQGYSVESTRIQVRFARPEASAKKLYPIITQQMMAMQYPIQYQPVYIMVPMQAPAISVPQ